jgi:hypothetical protein
MHQVASGPIGPYEGEIMDHVILSFLLFAAAWCYYLFDVCYIQKVL